MTIFQEEMQRKAQHYGCITEYSEEDQLLYIGCKNVYLTGITAEGYLHYTSKDLTVPEAKEIFARLTDDAETVREYVGLYESAPQMKPKDVQNYYFASSVVGGLPRVPRYGVERVRRSGK